MPDIVDAIVDLTETGSSLRRNGLRILETLLTSYTELVANPAAHEDDGQAVGDGGHRAAAARRHPGPRPACCSS